MKPTEIVDEIIPETIEYQRQLKQMWVDIGVYSVVQYDFDKEFEVHYDMDNKNYYILADGKKFALLNAAPRQPKSWCSQTP